MNPYPLASIREKYSTLRDVCYLNTGTVGVMSEQVLRAHLERIAHYERSGHFGEPDAKCGYDDARRELARLIHAGTSEVALTRNASDGINLVLASLDVPDGRKLITTDQEHPAVLLPITTLARRTSGSVEIISLTGSDEHILTEFQTLLDQGDVFLAVLSHVSCESGRRLPISEMCRLCREHDVLSLVDGAQSVGQFEVDVADVGCDFMTGNGHKWLCGPKGTGFLYVRRGLIPSLTPPFIGDGAIDPSFDRGWYERPGTVPELTYRDDAQRFEFGTRNWHHFGSLADAIREWRELGTLAIERHISDTSDDLKQRLMDRPGITVHSPLAWARSSGLVAFSADGWKGTELSQLLWQQYGIIQRRVQIPSGVRISCAHFTSEDDIDHLMHAIDEVVAGSGSRVH